MIPAVPLTVQQATLVQIDGPFSLPVAPPADGLATNGTIRGGLKLALQPKLAEGLPGVRDWFARYPFACLEQKTSKSIGPARRQAVAGRGRADSDLPGCRRPGQLLPAARGRRPRGSDILTAYLLAATHEAASLNPAFALSDEVRAPMERGLIRVCRRPHPAQLLVAAQDLDVRKLAAIEALSRYGKAQGRHAGQPHPRAQPVAHHARDRLAEHPASACRTCRSASSGWQRRTQILKSRLSWQGTKMTFSTEQSDHWWWLMTNGDVNTARLMLAVMDDPAWKDDMGRLANGFIARQQRGAWHTTTANLWGGLALEKFSAKFEATPVAGRTRATLAAASANVDWARRWSGSRPPMPAARRTRPRCLAPPPPPAIPARQHDVAALGQAAAPQTLSVTHQGPGKPWLTLQSLAAVELKAPFNAGYQISRSVTPVEQAVPGKLTRGDVLRVTLEVNASADMTWVVITDPVPGGATILGSGLGRDSQIATQGEKREGWAWPAFEERSFEAFRSYYEYLPKGVVKMQYTVRLNNVGDFALPPTRVEAMYAPEMFGEAPNARVKVEAAK
jgi:hypothetical protein